MRSKAVHIDYSYPSFGSGLNYLGVTLGFLFNSRNDRISHEAELSSLGLRRSEVPGSFKVVDGVAGLRYQLSFNFRPRRKLQPQLGVSVLNQFSSTRNVPISSTMYERRNEELHFQFAIVPQIKYCLSPKWFVDYAMGFPVFDVIGKFQRIFNPNLPIRQQRNGGYDASLFRYSKSYSVRVGIGFKLN